MNIACCHIARLSLSVITPIAFTACGGSSPPPHVGAATSGGPGPGGTVPGPNTTYRVGGTVRALSVRVSQSNCSIRPLWRVTLRSWNKSI